MAECEKNISVLKGIPFDIDAASLVESLRIRAGSEEETTFRELVENARETANPKAIYRTCFVDCVNNDEVTIEGVRFESRLLSKKLHSVGRVFPFVITSGRELYEYPLDRTDFLKIFLWDSLLE
ncbi:vitamin B12 dependent methionine synthase, partial [Mesotoga sp. SC_3PWM13N19]